MENFDVDTLINIIVLNTKALEFYADEKNYESKIIGGMGSNSPIEMDKGAQAKFALEQSDFIDNYITSINDGLKNTFSNNIEGEDMIKFIEQLKRINGE